MKHTKLFIMIAGFCMAAAAQQARKSAIIDSARLLADLRVLSGDEMQGRQVGSQGSEKARAFVIERFKASGILPLGAGYEHPFTFSARERVFRERRGVNVIGHIKGRRYPGRYIVISAHYDHIGTIDGQVFNGADDNASGTAALFAIGRYFGTYPPANSLIFAAFDAEESGLRGSQAFLAQPPVDRPRLMLNLNADMVGRAPDDKLFVVGTALQPFLKPYIEPLLGASPVNLLFGHEGGRQSDDWTRDSDHYSFLQAKIPALYFGVEDYDQHHRATDDYETISHDFYVRAVETLVKITERFDANLDPVEKARLAGIGQ